MKKPAKDLPARRRTELLATLKARFEEHPKRHPGVDWAKVQRALEGQPEKLWSLGEMEDSGGEPDVVRLDAKSDALHFVDCAAETPKGRRSCCYDQAALIARKENKPKHSALALAEAMGVEVLSEAQYRALQQLGAFDLKTSSWVQTPAAIRKLGGALFCDRRYEQVFTYHNGAESYYAARAFRGALAL